MSNNLRERYLVPALMVAIFGSLLLVVISRLTADDVDSSPVADVESRAATIDESSAEPLFIVVENPPTLIGGLAAVAERINYPDLAKKAGIEGRVIVQFVVDKTGDVRDAVVLRGIGAGCDEEALRVVSEMKFTPGRQRGQAVNVKMSIPIQFRLDQ